MFKCSEYSSLEMPNLYILNERNTNKPDGNSEGTTELPCPWRAGSMGSGRQRWTLLEK